MIRPVTYEDILNDPNAQGLLEEYAKECSLPELGEPCPQPELYKLLESKGGMQVFGVYDGYCKDDPLVGFASVLIYMLPHYGKMVATTESIFISREYRKTTYGVDLMGFIESYARHMGVETFLYSAPVGSRFDRLLASVSRHSNNVYVRQL